MLDKEDDREGEDDVSLGGSWETLTPFQSQWYKVSDFNSSLSFW